MPSPFILDAEPAIVSANEAFASRFEILDSGFASDRKKEFLHAKQHTLGALYYSDGRIMEMSVRPGGHNGDHVTALDPAFLVGTTDTSGLRRIADNSIYLGNFMGHYGHFITESLSRMWYLISKTASRHFDHYVYFPFIFDDGRIAMADFHKYFLDLFGIPMERLYFISEPVVFERIVVPQQLWTVNKSCNGALRSLYAAVRQRHQGTSRVARIFLSRLPTGYNRFPNISEVEKLFVAYGFRVLYPEKTEIAQQLNAYANCKIIAGFAGSGLHNCVFTAANTLVIELCDSRCREQPLLMQSICNDLAQVSATHIPYVESGTEGADIGKIEERLKVILNGFETRNIAI